MISSKYVNFHNTQKGKYVHDRIEIINESDVATKFQFDIDNRSSPFTFEPTHGELLPWKHMFIKITFRMKKKGPYYQQIFCLVQNQVRFHCLKFGICELQIYLKNAEDTDEAPLDFLA